MRDMKHVSMNVHIGDQHQRSDLKQLHGAAERVLLRIPAVIPDQGHVADGVD